MRSDVATFARVRAAIRDRAVPNDLAGLCVACAVGLVYAGGLAGFCLLDAWPRLVFLGLAAFAVGMLFIVGHDACHLSLVRSARLNRIIGRLAFAPSLHPFAAWEIGHNRRHHAFTNLRYLDYVWCPWSAEEYSKKPAFARFLYRLYHTPLGIGLYYPIEIWLKHMWLGDSRDRSHPDYGRVLADRATAALVFAVILAACALVSVRSGASLPTALANASIAGFAPLVVYHYLMSVVIFVHHRHPDVVWYDVAADYDPFASQLSGTVHATLARPLELAFLEIFQHTAHHVDSHIPLYRLASAQATLEQRFRSKVVRAPLNLRYFLQILRDCQVYDYERRSWQNVRSCRAIAVART
jgi:omega-6 fatty acid desaturase (delta-12 desaturase)